MGKKKYSAPYDNLVNLGILEHICQKVWVNL